MMRRLAPRSIHSRETTASNLDRRTIAAPTPSILGVHVAPHLMQVAPARLQDSRATVAVS
jgi:hypothetical protein